MTTDTTQTAAGAPVRSEDLLACAGDAGCVPRGDCLMVHLRVPMRVNQWERKAVPLCASCRKALRGQWRHANTQGQPRREKE